MKNETQCQGEKTNIYLDDELYEKLKNDAERFKITRKDGSPNESRFINLVIKNFSGEYVHMTECRYENTLKMISEEVCDMSMDKLDRIARMVAYTNIDLLCKAKGRPCHNLSMYICEENWPVILKPLNRTFKDKGISTYIREMLHAFMQLPVYRREQLIYADRIAAVEEAIRLHESVCYKHPETQKWHHFFPAYIGYSDHEFYNYVVGQIDNEEHNTYPVRIANMVGVCAAAEPAVFTEDFNVYLERMKKNGIQFAVQDNRIFTVTVTRKGYDTFRKRYMERPVAVNTEFMDNDTVVMTFDCSEFQLDAFFRPFDGQIVEIRG